MYRVSGPWLKLLSAVGVILILVEDRKSSAQHSRSDNHNRNGWGTVLLTRCTRPQSRRETLDRRGRVCTA